MQRSFIKNFAPGWPTDGSSVDMEARITGLPKTAEVVALDVELTISVKSAGVGAFALADQDDDTIVGSIIRKVRASYNGETDNVNVAPDVLRDFANYAFEQDPYAMYGASRVGVSIPGSASAAIQLVKTIRIPLMNKQKENPNQNALSGLQLNRDGRVNLDAAGVTLAALNALVLLNGTANITAVGVPKLFVVLGKKRKKGFVGPTQFIRVRNETQNPDSETGPLLDELVFELRAPSTLDGITGTLSIETDGEFGVKGTLPSQLAAGFVTMTKGGDGRAAGMSYDLTSSQKHVAVPGGGAIQTTGRTPLVYVPGALTPDESEVPLTEQFRTFHWSQPPNGSGIAQVAYWRIGSLKASKTLDTIVELANDSSNRAVADVAGITPSEIIGGALAVKGGGSTGPGAMNGDLRDYKPAFLARPG